MPQSRLGAGLAVHRLLARCDAAVAYYTVERIFFELISGDSLAADGPMGSPDRLPSMNITQIAELLPEHWRLSRPDE